MIGLVTVAGQATGATLVGPASAPTGVSGLVSDGVTYNVTFSSASYNTAFGGVLPPFRSSTGVNSPGGDAGTDLANFLSAADVTGLNGNLCATVAGVPTQLCVLAIPDFYSNQLPTGFLSVVSLGLPLFPGLWGNTGETLFSPPLDPTASLGNVPNPGGPPLYVEWAVFTPVPEPSTFALLSLGLAAVGVMKRRKASAS